MQAVTIAATHELRAAVKTKQCFALRHHSHLKLARSLLLAVYASHNSCSNTTATRPLQYILKAKSHHLCPPGKEKQSPASQHINGPHTVACLSLLVLLVESDHDHDSIYSSSRH
jgi:hypothetical protein